MADNTTTKQASDASKTPEKQTVGSISYIRKIIVAYAFSLVIFVGVPWFLYTTTIHRATLPVEDINDIKNQLDQVHVITPVYLRLSNAKEDFIPAVQKAVESKLHLEHPDLKDLWSLDLRRITDSVDVNPNEDIIVDFKVLPDPEDDSPESSFSVSPFNKEISVTLSNTVIQGNMVEKFVSDILIDRIFDHEISKFESLKANEGKVHDNVVFPYSSKYNLIFSLFVEDGHPTNWDAASIEMLFTPLLKTLKHYANFTISTQVQYYSKPNVQADYDEESKKYVIKESELSNFINYGDWNLNNNDLSPSINFMVYYPSSNAEKIPTVIENSTSNSFLVPQFGGLHVLNKKVDIVNDDEEVFISDTELIEILEIFSTQLFRLLGVPVSNQNNMLLRIDSLTKFSIISNLQQSIQTLSSLLKLTNELHEISVPELTKDYVNKSLEALKNSLASLSIPDIKQAMVWSSLSLRNSYSAFFDKDIVQQVYFPDEHKLAVFLPLLGPLCSILLFSTVKLVKELKQKK